MLRERGRERAVRPVTVGGDRPFLCRINDLGSPRRLNPRQPAADVAAFAGGSLQRRGKWIVATGVKYHQAKHMGAVDCAQDLADRHRLEIDVTIGQKLRVDGYPPRSRKPVAPLRGRRGRDRWRA